MRDLKEIRQQIEDTAKRLFCKVVEEEIQPGDLYLACRNTGVKLLQCKQNNGSFIVPTTNDYPYDVKECFKIVHEEQVFHRVY